MQLHIVQRFMKTTALRSSHLKMLFTIISLLFLSSLTSSSEAQTWIKAGYWYSGSDLPIPDTDSTLFTHLTCAFAHINTSTYELSISPSDEPYISTFTDVVRQKNPSIITLLSIWAGDSNFSTFFSMATQPSHRSIFIESSIQTARLYGFHGLDLYGIKPDTSPNNMRDMGILFDDWRTAINRESKDSTRSQLVLTMAGHYLPADKMVLVLAYHGYAWTLVDPMANEIGSPGRGPSVTLDGSMSISAEFPWLTCSQVSLLFEPMLHLLPQISYKRTEKVFFSSFCFQPVYAAICLL